jgi:hypothetical protein
MVKGEESREAARIRLNRKNARAGVCEWLRSQQRARQGRFGKGAFVQLSDGLEGVDEKRKENVRRQSSRVWMSKTKNEGVCACGCVRENKAGLGMEMREEEEARLRRGE